MARARKKAKAPAGAESQATIGSTTTNVEADDEGLWSAWTAWLKKRKRSHDQVTRTDVFAFAGEGSTISPSRIALLHAKKGHHIVGV